MSARRPEPPTECAVCGADLPRNARACPECGADERTGWREQSIYDGLDLPEDRPDDTRAGPSGSTGLAWYWLAAASAVLFALVALVLGFL